MTTCRRGLSGWLSGWESFGTPTRPAGLMMRVVSSGSHPRNFDLFFFFSAGGQAVSNTILELAPRQLGASPAEIGRAGHPFRRRAQRQLPMPITSVQLIDVLAAGHPSILLLTFQKPTRGLRHILSTIPHTARIQCHHSSLPWLINLGTGQHPVTSARACQSVCTRLISETAAAKPDRCFLVVCVRRRLLVYLLPKLVSSCLAVIVTGT